VFLSGGLDSSLVAAFASRLRNDVTYFTLGVSEDRQAVDTVVAALGLVDVRVLSLPQPANIPALIRAVVHATESFNPSIVSNGLATYLLAQAAHNAGIKVVLTGEGADELFGGYHSFREQDPWLEVREQLIDDMQFTELRRLDMSCMAHSVEPRCPFLDRSMRAISDGLGYPELYDGRENKVALRRGFKGLLPPEILHRRKTSFDVGSGIRGEVVRYLRRNGRSERDELRQVWEETFFYESSEPYFHAYPVFDPAIDLRGESHR
jgi:asparagine synthase (glutamine-hydrolysing)